MNRIDENFNHCAECQMLVTDGEYHPYAACVLYRQLGQADKVRSCLNSVIQYAQGKCVFEATGGEKLPTLPHVCEACGVQQYADGKCANCGKERLRATGTDGEGEREALLSSEVALEIARLIRGHNSEYYSTREGLAELEAVISRHFANKCLTAPSLPAEGLIADRDRAYAEAEEWRKEQWAKSAPAEAEEPQR